MVLDQQIPLEKAFRGPRDLKERLGGSLDAAEIAGMDPERLAKLFATPPAIHRFPASMAGRVQELCRVVSDRYGDDAAAVWRGATSGQELLGTIKSLPGFGDQKARIFLALLGKQLGVRPKGWEEAAGVYGQEGSLRSVADIVDPESLAKVRAFKKEMKLQARAEHAPATTKNPRSGARATKR